MNDEAGHRDPCGTPFQLMPSGVYSEADFKRITRALGVSASRVNCHAKEFEAAAWWYRSWREPFQKRNPTRLRKKLEQIAKDARRLLLQLGIEDPGQAMDGPGDREVFDALGLWTRTSDDLVAEATGRIGRLVEILDATEAAKLLERLAKRAAQETRDLGSLTVPPGNSGDRAANDWIASMMGLYQTITSTAPRTSVAGPGRKNEGIAGGPLLRFLRAAGGPLGIQLDEDALRKRARTILEHPSGN